MKHTLRWHAGELVIGVCEGIILFGAGWLMGHYM